MENQFFKAKSSLKTHSFFVCLSRLFDIVNKVLKKFRKSILNMIKHHYYIINNIYSLLFARNNYLKYTVR